VSLSISKHVEQESDRCLRAYAENPKLILEAAGIEAAVIYGGYGHRQIYELVQNGADAMLKAPGRIELVVTETALYCANEGEPIDCEGVDVLLSSSISNKRGDEIGRFGMGFKSVLGLTDSPAIFSSSGAFQFSTELAERRIRPLCPHADKLPILRIAESLEVEQSMRADPTLRRLHSWASTVVRLPFAHEHGWLDDSLRNFPAEFLLFAPHVRRLTITDARQGGIIREIEAERLEAEEILLVEKDRYTSWKVFGTVIEPNTDAIRDAGERSGRNRIPLSWAVPAVRHEQLGSFWSFFPTTLKTSLSGILNAPWKTNEDRLNLLPGSFNDQLLSAAAKLVIAKLPELVRTEDPGSLLDVLPGRESRGWADEQLAREIYTLATSASIVADQNGNLAPAKTLKLPPENLPLNALVAWNESAKRPVGWTHQSLERPQRRSRLERLAGNNALVADVAAWLEALTEAGGSQGAVTALRCAAILDSASFAPDKVRRARIVPTVDGNWVAPEPNRVFLPSDYDAVSTTTDFVNRIAADDPLARAALIQFGIREADPVSELRALVLENLSDLGVDAWRRLWDVVAAVGEGSISVLRPSAMAGTLRVRNRLGEFVPLLSALLPGSIVGLDEEDAVATIDIDYHCRHLEILRSVGAVDAPQQGYPMQSGNIIDAYRRTAVEQYRAKMKSMPRDRSDLVLQPKVGVGPLDVFDHLSDRAKAAFTHDALQFESESWTMANVRQPKTLPLNMEWSPCTWLLRKRGVLRTSQGLRRVSDSYSSRLEGLAPYFAVAELAFELSDRLGIRTVLKPEELQETMMSIIESDEEQPPVALYVAASRSVPAPMQLRCIVGNGLENRPTSEIRLLRSADSAERLLSANVPHISVNDEDGETLASRWNLSFWTPSAENFRTEVEPGDPSPPVPLFDRFPAFRDHTDDQIGLVACTSVIVQEISDRGTVIEPRSFHREGMIGYYAESLDEEELWFEVGRSLLPPLAELLLHSLRPQSANSITIAANREELAISNRPQKVIQALTVPEKLLAALGDEALRRRLPENLQDAVASERGSGQLSPGEIAEVALAVYASDVLQTYRSELDDAGFDTPTQWAGSYRAREFVRRLGFPDSFAGTPTPAREPLISVPGPSRLPALHGYQQRIVDEMQKIFRGRGGFRGFISLPTGAGKTRVAVQALVTGIVSGALRKPILWVAQQDELCEQAVQTWREVWPALGNEHILSVSRLWGSNRVARIDGLQIVIATIAKLDHVVKDHTYDWLSDVGALIIDEAHTSITPSYTELLYWAGFGRSREKDKAPLIGLSATPERGNEVESARLVERYDRRRLDADAFADRDAYEALQEMGVLARVQHEKLEGAFITPDDADLQQFRIFRKLSADFEERIGRDKTRNREILRSIASKPADWPILVFAASVEHAQILAALLTLNGISSACITGQTAVGARADAIQKFRSGKLRVLTNYSVLAQGFDAPAVRALYVTRPTFSTNLYQQMIGRGLRGPKNGGKSECLIVNVDDNVEMYQEQLAFRKFAYLWSDAEEKSISV
jgi:superfamily II DNA or RNA helicase